MWIRFGLLIISTIDLGGCATTQQAEQPIPSIICNAGSDCDAKWSRAVTWVSENSAYRIQVQTDTLIQPFAAAEDSDTGRSVTVAPCRSVRPTTRPRAVPPPANNVVYACDQ